MTCVSNLVETPPLTLKDAMPFGKYKDLSIGDIISRDPNYVAWAIKNIGDFKLDKEAYRMYKQRRFW